MHFIIILKVNFNVKSVTFFWSRLFCATRLQMCRRRSSCFVFFLILVVQQLSWSFFPPTSNCSNLKHCSPLLAFLLVNTCIAFEIKFLFVQSKFTIDTLSHLALINCTDVKLFTLRLLNWVRKNLEKPQTGKRGNLRKYHRGGILLPRMDRCEINFNCTEHKKQDKTYSLRMYKKIHEPQNLLFYKSGCMEYVLMYLYFLFRQT